MVVGLQPALEGPGASVLVPVANTTVPVESVTVKVAPEEFADPLESVPLPLSVNLPGIGPVAVPSAVKVKVSEGEVVPGRHTWDEEKVVPGVGGLPAVRTSPPSVGVAAPAPNVGS